MLNPISNNNNDNKTNQTQTTSTSPTARAQNSQNLSELKTTLITLRESKKMDEIINFFQKNPFNDPTFMTFALEVFDCLLEYSKNLTDPKKQEPYIDLFHKMVLHYSYQHALETYFNVIEKLNTAFPGNEKLESICFQTMEIFMLSDDRNIFKAAPEIFQKYKTLSRNLKFTITEDKRALIDFIEGKEHLLNQPDTEPEESGTNGLIDAIMEIYFQPEQIN